jgi:nucleotide-binding universal stress UspA family protein
MKTIICPVDFSTESDNAALYASQISKQFKSRIILIHVYETPVLFTEASIQVAQEIEASLRTTVQERIEKLKERLLSIINDAHIESRILQGFPVQEICNCAIKEDADVIIMGASGKGRIERTIIGSTSSKVISDANCPVLLIPKNIKYSGIERIVFATDLNEDNLTAAKQILLFAKHFNSEIVFVYVDDNNLLHSNEYISNMSKKIRSHIHYNRISGYVSENISITGGIEAFLKKHPADLLVMFNHNRHFPNNFLNPSLTRKMSRLTKTPLLSLPVQVHVFAEV